MHNMCRHIHRTHASTHEHTRTHTSAPLHIHTRAPIHTHTPIHPHTHPHTRSRTRTRTHVRTHAHSPTHPPPPHTRTRARTHSYLSVPCTLYRALQLTLYCRPWYVAAATIEKDLVIAIDLSSGMKPHFIIAKTLAQLILLTTQPNDNVSWQRDC